MKKGIGFFIAAFILLILCGCDPLADKHPYTQRYTKWVASDVEMYFIVKTVGDMTGEIHFNGTITKIEALFQSSLFIMEPLYPEEGLTASEYQILSGTCDYYQNKFVVHHIKVNRPELFDDSITRLVFVKDKDYVPEDLE